jgi:hypothetical protein
MTRARRSIDSRRHSRRLAQAALAVGCAVVLSACGGDAADQPGPAVPDGAAEATFVSLDAVPDEVQAAIADAAERFGVPESQVAVAGALRVVWSDGSLGCPEDGMMYTQALVDGYLLTLEVDGRRVDYHGENGQPPFLCER